jgi:hypothetical protein
MSRAADRLFPEVDTVFDPPLYTEAELTCIQNHLGESPGVARTAEDFPRTHDSIPPVANALQRFYDLEQQAELGRVVGWVGLEEISGHIDLWFERQRRYAKHKANDPEGKGFHPELNTFDSRGNAHPFGPGSSAGRVRFPLNLVSMAERSRENFAADLSRKVGVSPEGDTSQYNREACLHDDEGYVDCPVAGCVKRFDFDPDSQKSRNSAWARLGSHCAQTKKEPDDHRLARQEIFS